MQYRQFKAVGQDVSLLGMGVMRLQQNEDGEVDEQKGIELIRYAIDHGINYIDTGYPYHKGASERIIGKALKDGYREKVLLADKIPVWLADSAEDQDRIFQEQLQRLDVDCIDMYLVHNITRENWKRAENYKTFDFLAKKKEEGTIRHIGFSFHGDYELFKEVIATHPWEFCQIQMNYVDQDKQATLKGLEYARRKGLDVVIMEPLKGGRLSDKVPPSVREIWDDAIADGLSPADRTPAEWGFRWIAAQPGVTLILSGMSSIEQMDENIATFSKDDIGQLSEAEQAVIEKASAEYKSKIKYGCTDCGYCVPCPQGIRIPNIIGHLNNWLAYNHNPSTKTEYTLWLPKHASDCVRCKACEDKCPQVLPITAIMDEAEKEFGV